MVEAGKGSGVIRSFGYAAMDKSGRLSPFEFVRREPGPRDVLIEIAYCGICHSDIHSARSEWGNSRYPVVPGHEIVGKIAAVGGEVTRFKVGDLAGVGCMVESCGECEACRAGAEYECHRDGPVWTYGSEERHIGGNTYGGYSNNMVADQNFVLKIPDGMDPASAAPLLCAGTTTYTPLAHWKVGQGSRIGIMGLGGLGHIAVKISKSLGAYVVVFTTSTDKANDAKRLGADDAVISTESSAMKKYKGKLDFLLDTISASHDIDRFLQQLGLDGKLVLVGLPSEQLKVMPFSLVGGHHVLAGSGLDGIKGTQKMLDYCAENGISADIELIPIQKVNEAHARILKGDVRYRFVIDMSSLTGR